MEIFVQSLTGQRYRIEYELSDTVYALKQKLSAQTGIPALEQAWVHSGRQLKDSTILKDIDPAKLGNISFTRLTRKVELSDHGPKPLDESSSEVQEAKVTSQIFVKHVTGRMYSIACESSDTIYALKEKLADLTKIPASEQAWTHSGRELLDSKTLGDLGLGKLGNITFSRVSKVEEAKIASPDEGLEKLDDISFSSSSEVQKAKVASQINQIFVKHVTGRMYSIECKSSDTIYALKERLATQTGISASEQAWTHSGRVLSDSKILGDLGPGKLGNITFSRVSKKQEAKNASEASSSSGALSGASSSSSRSAFFKPAPVVSEELPMHSRKFTDLPLEFRNYLASQASEASQKSGGKLISAEDYWEQSETRAEKSKFELVEDYEQEHPERRQTPR